MSLVLVTPDGQNAPSVVYLVCTPPTTTLGVRGQAPLAVRFSRTSTAVDAGVVALRVGALLPFRGGSTTPALTFAGSGITHLTTSAHGKPHGTKALRIRDVDHDRAGTIETDRNMQDQIATSENWAIENDALAFPIVVVAGENNRNPVHKHVRGTVQPPDRQVTALGNVVVPDDRTVGIEHVVDVLRHCRRLGARHHDKRGAGLLPNDAKQERENQ